MSSTRPLSQLIHFPIQSGTGGAPVITLHDHNQFAQDVADWGTAASPQGRVIALESYKGVFVSHDVVGYTWFLGPLEAPSPIFFGDSLSEIERFLWDEIDRSKQSPAPLPFLVGVGQGGIMALAAALALPDMLSGVIAVDAFLPIVGGWEPPLAPMNNLPILLLNPKVSTHPRVLEGVKLQQQLSDWGATVESRNVGSNPADGDVLSQWMARQENRYYSPSEE